MAHISEFQSLTPSVLSWPSHEDKFHGVVVAEVTCEGLRKSLILENLGRQAPPIPALPQRNVFPNSLSDQNAKRHPFWLDSRGDSGQVAEGGSQFCH